MNEILYKRIAKEANQYIQSDAVEPENMHLAFGDFINGARWALQNQWISIEEDLPPYDKAVIGIDYMPELTWDDQTIIFVHRSNNPDVVTDKNKFCVYPPTFCKVTHWMEIPSLKGDK